MEQTVNLTLLQGWLDRHGIGELEQLSGVSVHTIMKVKNRQKPVVPKRPKTRIRLAEAIGVTEHDLFPPAVTGSKRRAKSA